MNNKIVSFCLASIIGVLSVPNAIAQCAGCDADKNKQDREQVEKQKTAGAVTEKQIRDQQPQRPQGNQTDTRRVGTPNQSTMDK